MRFIQILLLCSFYAQAAAALDERLYPSSESLDFRISSLSVMSHSRASYSAQTIAGHFESDDYSRQITVGYYGSEIELVTDETPHGKTEPFDIDVHAASIDNRARARVSNAAASADIAIITKRTKDGLTINGDFSVRAEASIKQSGANAGVTVGFGIETRGAQDVVINGCDLFLFMDEIENSPLAHHFSRSGTMCSFTIGINLVDGEDGRYFFLGLETRVDVGSERRQAKNERKSGLFSITVTPACPSDTPTVRVNTDGPLKNCLTPLISAINGNFPGLVKIGGRWPRCISLDHLPVIDSTDWYTATGGTCAHADFTDRHRDRPSGRFDSVPNHALRECSAPGPRLDRFEVYAVTGGGCRMGGYLSSPSPHHSGNALDFFINDANDPPDRCQAIAGDRIRDWLLNEASTNTTIKNIIWNGAEYPRSKGFAAQPISVSGPHYDHVHLRCSP